MKPYYVDEYITLYLGDCRDVLPQLNLEAFCWTDPPYNVGKNYEVWNDSLSESSYLGFCCEWIGQVKRLCNELCIYPPRKYHLDYWNLLGKNFRQIPLTWNSEGAVRGGWSNQHAHLLTNAKPKIYTKDWWHNIPRTGMGYLFREQTHGHPGYTSEALTNQVLTHLADSSDLILDCFAGTGTTLRCAKDLNRKAIGIEINERYCEIAVQRLSQQVLSLFS